MTKKELEKRVWNLCLYKRKSKEYPAAVVGVLFNVNWDINETGFPPPPLAIQLRRRLETRLGIIGNRLNGNIIGKCAEVGAANKILRTRPYVDTNHLVFTQAIRPRTMQRIPMCLNCDKVFS